MRLRQPSVFWILLCISPSILIAEEAIVSQEADLRVFFDRGDRYFYSCEEEFHRSIEEYQKVLAIDPDNYEAHWKIARSMFFIGYISGDPEKQKKYGREGYKVYGARAVELRPDRVEGHLFYALSLGMYIRGIGTLKAFFRGLDRLYYKEISKAVEIDPGFEDGFPLISLGRYYYELPWFLRDVDKALEYYHRGLGYDSPPYAPGGRFFIAEGYLEKGEREKAREQLEFILTLPPHPGVPDCEEEGYERRARSLLKSIDGEGIEPFVP